MDPHTAAIVAQMRACARAIEVGLDFERCRLDCRRIGHVLRRTDPGLAPVHAVLLDDVEGAHLLLGGVALILKDQVREAEMWMCEADDAVG